MTQTGATLRRRIRHAAIAGIAAAAALALAACSSTGSGGEASGGSNYPQHPVQLIVGFAAGGALDLVAREVAKDIPQDFGQSVVVVNQAGDGGVIGASAMLGAKPDGYTAYLGSVAAMAIQPWREGVDVPYKGPDDYTPVAGLLYFPQVLAVSASAPYDTPQDFVDYAKSHPGEIRVGTGGVGTLPDVALQEMIQELSVDITSVPFQGFAQSVPALLGGSIEAIISSPADVAQHVASGDMKIIGSFNDKPIPSLPDVESFTTAGVTYTQNNYYFVLLPKDTPADVTETLQDALKAAIESDSFTTWAEANSAIVQYKDSSELGETLQTDYDRYKKIIGDLGL
ncbi:Bug family tripartite tricarboxylate transporter substrate binding protein [Compostimonas suwonensis]|nr:tripartite tricarboxylate transporter substrate binding protein [Compostimonas suwonensis]